MTISLRVSGAWKEVASAKVRVGGAWKTVASAKVYTGGAWKDVPGFAPAMTASISPTSVSGFNSGIGIIISDTATCTPSGGTAPFTYSWSITSGTATITSPASASTTFYEYLAFDTAVGEATCTVTDANGTTATASVSYTLTSFDGGFL